MSHNESCDLYSRPASEEVGQIFAGLMTVHRHMIIRLPYGHIQCKIKKGQFSSLTPQQLARLVYHSKPLR